MLTDARRARAGPAAAWLLAAVLLAACTGAPVPPDTPARSDPDPAVPAGGAAGPAAPTGPDPAEPAMDPPAADPPAADPPAADPPAAEEPAATTPVPRVALPSGQGPAAAPAAAGVRFSVDPIMMAWRDSRLLVFGRGLGYQGLFALHPGGAVETMLTLAPAPVIVKAEPLASGAVLAAVYHPAELWLYPVEGEPRFLLAGHTFSVAPDGSRALLYGIHGDTWLLDAHGGSVSPAAGIPSYGFPYSGTGVTWLPDSRHVLAWRGGNGDLSTALVDVVAGRDVIEVGRPGHSAYGTLSPDGRYLAVVWVAEDEKVWQEEAAFAEPIGRELSVHDVKTGAAVAFAPAGPEDRVIGPPVWVEEAAWFAVGRYEKVAWPTVMYRPQAVRQWQLTVDGAAGPLPAEGTPADMAPQALSPSGRYVAFFAGNPWGRAVVILDRTANRTVTTIPGWRARWLAGDRLAVVADDATAWQVYDAAGARLGSVAADFWRLYPAPDARHVAASGDGWVDIIPIP